MTELAEQLKRLDISVNHFAEMVGIRTSAMRLLVLGVNKPRADTQMKIDEALKHVRSCPTCGRAFLKEKSDDTDAAVQGPKPKKERR